MKHFTCLLVVMCALSTMQVPSVGAKETNQDTLIGKQIVHQKELHKVLGPGDWVHHEKGHPQYLIVQGRLREDKTKYYCRCPEHDYTLEKEFNCTEVIYLTGKEIRKRLKKEKRK